MTEARFRLAPGLHPVVELGVGDTRGGADEAVWNVARWDTAGRWAGTEPSWLDVSCHVVALDCHIGRLRAATRFDTGTATITLANPDGWADVLADPADPATLALRPGRPIRWGIARPGEPTRWKWRGFVDVHTATYAGRVPDADLATLSCVDALGEVGRVELAALPAPVGAGEGPTARLNRILDAAGWRTAWRHLDPAATPLVATDLAGQTIDLLGQTADSAAGSIYGDVDGNVRFRNRDWQMFPPGRVPDAVVGTGPGADTCPLDVTVEFARADTATRTLADDGDPASGPAVVRNDPAAQLLYGVETVTIADLVTANPVQQGVIADRLLATLGVGAQPRIAALTLDAAHDGAADVMLEATDPFTPSLWRVAFGRDTRTVYDAELLVVGADHHFDAATWQTTVALDAAGPWRAAGGRWDGAAWDRATWSDVAAVHTEAVALLERLART